MTHHHDAAQTTPATFDYRMLGQHLRMHLQADGRGYRAISRDIGVAVAALSRLTAGQPVAAHTIFAVCDWLKCDPRRFYEPPCFTAAHVKHFGQDRSKATVSPSLPRKGADAQSGFGGEHSKRDGASGLMAGSHAAHGDEPETSDGASGPMAGSHAAHGDETKTSQTPHHRCYADAGLG